jgi:hypothetical protein
MSRTRLLHAGQATDEDVAACSIAARYVWALLPCHADREGRLLDKPFTLKLAILPADPVDMNALLDELAGKNLITRYVAGGRHYIAIRTFLRHQHPHKNEIESEIPAPPGPSGSDQGPNGSGQGPSNSNHGTRESDQGASHSLQGRRHSDQGASGCDPGTVDPWIDPPQEHAKSSGKNGHADSPAIGATVARTKERVTRAKVGTARADPDPNPDPDPVSGSGSTHTGARAGSLCTGHDLLRWYGLERRDQVTGAVDWHVPKASDGKATTFAEGLGAEEVGDVRPTMRLHFQELKQGGGKAAAALANPTLGFAWWLADFTRLTESIHNVTPATRAPPQTGPRVGADDEIRAAMDRASERIAARTGH